jgi:hypothetical protein
VLAEANGIIKDLATHTAGTVVANRPLVKEENMWRVLSVTVGLLVTSGWANGCTMSPAEVKAHREALAQIDAK